MESVKSEVRLRGVALSQGIALGRACFFRRISVGADTLIDDPGGEGSRLGGALNWMVERLEALTREAESRLDRELADVFRVHRLILEDPTLRQRLFQIVESEGCTAEHAVERQLGRFQQELKALDLAYMRERVADVADLQRGLLDRLRRASPSRYCKDMPHCRISHCRLGNDHILIAGELTPSLVIEVDDRTRGFLLKKGGRNSHAAILANALNLPAVSGIPHPQETVPPDAQVLIDGDNGEVILNPSADTLRRYRSREDSQRLPVTDPIPELRVLANIDLAAGLHDALAANADGIGLYRTEIEPLAKGRLLTETEQEARYSAVVEAMGDRPVCIRLLDLGADKTADWLDLPTEDNPALGLRGARLLLTRPELLRSQARALARASLRGPVRVIYPMIVDLAQFRRLRTLCDLADTDLPPGRLLHGVMFEVPSACLQARSILEHADCGCIGTNDLIQYLFAADRMNAALQEENWFDSPVLWEVIENLARIAKETGKPLSVCGELAGDPRFTCRIMETGITAVSTTPRRIADVRRAARG